MRKGAMNEAELRAFLQGPVPDVSQIRDVPYDQLSPGQCDEQTEYGTSAGSRYCGAPRTPGFKLCRYHLFTALHNGEPVDELRT